VNAEVVHNDFVTFPELWTQHLTDVGGEDLHVGRTLDQERSVNAVLAQGGDKGRSRPMAVRHGADAALAPAAPAVEAGHLGVERRLVDEDQAPRIPLRLLAAPELTRGRYIRPVLLGGARRFF